MPDLTCLMCRVSWHSLRSARVGKCPALGSARRQRWRERNRQVPHGIRPYKITHIILITMASIRTVRKSRLLLESLLLGSFLYVPLRTCGCVCVGSSSVLLSVWVILFFVSLSPPTLFNYIRSLSVFYPFTQFLSLWLCLYVSLSPSLSVCLSLYIYLFIYMCIYMSLFCLYVSLCL